MGDNERQKLDGGIKRKASKMIEIFGHSFEHISIVRAIGSPVYAYLVRADEGYCIRSARLEENIYKKITTIYETDNFDEVIVIPENELPEGAEILGTTTPEPETI